MTGPLLDKAKIATFLGVSESTLARWRTLGVGPTFIKLGDHKNALVRYFPIQRVSDLPVVDQESPK